MRRQKPPSGKPLGLPELLAIALGGMIGGGIFTILRHAILAMALTASTPALAVT